MKTVRETTFSRRSLIAASATAAGATAMSAALANASTRKPGFYINLKQDQGEISIVNFYEPFIAEVLPMFTEETGIKVNKLGTTSSNDQWWARLAAGEEIDFLIASVDWLQRGMAADFFLPIDRELVPNTDNLLPEFQEHEALTKDGQQYGSPTFRVYYSMTYNTNEFSEAPTSWDVTWDEQYSGKIALHDNTIARIGTTALVLGDDPLNPTKWDEITEKLLEQKPLVLKYWTDYQNGMELFANEEALVGQLTAGRTRMAMAEGAPINWTVPEEGCMTFLDTYAVPSTAKNPEGGMALINFLQKPEIAAMEMEMMHYDSVNQAARESLDPDILKTFELPEGANLVLTTDIDPAVRTKMDEVWTEVKLM